ncbi:MAG: hypothetical protein HY907_22990 [Deltaproteobacteria bacterium]|nr:hypothetical protein [Deltaproteobacteria bacterium]
MPVPRSVVAFGILALAAACGPDVRLATGDAQQDGDRESEDGAPIAEATEAMCVVDPPDLWEECARRGDVCAVLPDDGTSVELPVRFSTHVQVADLFLLIDASRTMTEEIDALQASMTSTILPELRARIPDIALGVGWFSDFAVDPYGEAGDRPFELLQTVTLDATSVQLAVNNLPSAAGGDSAGSQVEALYQSATGEGLGSWVSPHAGPDCRGAPCFRSGAMPIVVLLTDGPFHNGAPGGFGAPYAGIDPTPHSWIQAIDAMAPIHARVLGLPSFGCGCQKPGPRQNHRACRRPPW